MLRTISIAAAATVTAAWQPLTLSVPSRPDVTFVSRSYTVVARIKNSGSEGAEEWNAKVKKLKPPRKEIRREAPDLSSPTATFATLCRTCGVPDDRDAELDFDGFVLAFEQVFNRGVPLEPDYVDELRSSIGTGDDEVVTMTRWNSFHRKWVDGTTMEAHLGAAVERKRAAAAMDEERRLAAAEAEKKEKEWAQALEKAKSEAKQAAQAKPQLLANQVDEKKKYAGKWFEEREAAAQAAAQYRSLDPEKWREVVDDVGGLGEALEEIRRRVWTPLCAPTAILSELGAERVKGLLLYGPPGCGKSYLAGRLAAGLSRRPPTVVSGPEIMDKYVGNSEATLRSIFTSPPQVPHRPGDAEDVMMIAEANELHVVLLDEFDAIARQRSESGQGDSSTRDSVVNQLLELMDGVASLPVPTFVIALTNRRELIDNAVLRPGRLEVHVEVGYPDVVSREAILRIHAEKMRDSGRLQLDDAADADEADGCTLDQVDDDTYNAWISSMAQRTDGFSAAAIAAVIRAAVARALDRSVSSEDVQGCRVTGGDFHQAIADVKASSLELELLDASKEGDEPAGDGLAEPEAVAA